jgi:putative peptidoglycan lipid II flippase
MALFAAPYFDQQVLALGWAVCIGGLLQLAIQLPALKRIGMLPRFALDWKDEGVRRILMLMGPALLGVSVSQISLLINGIIASLFGDGRVSWLYYADRLMEFPAGMLGVALGTILLPSLSKYHADNNPVEYGKLLDWGLRLTLLLAAPAALGLALLSVPLIATLFHHGAFTAHDVLQTRDALIAYSIGLLGLILVKVLAPGFYARQNIRTPVKIAVISLLATQVMNVIFAWGLDMQHAGLALSIGLAACLNALLLYRGLRHSTIYTPQTGWPLFYAKLALALAVMGCVLWFFTGNGELWLQLGTLERVLRLMALVMFGAGAYFATLWALGFRLRDFKRRAA